MSIAAALDVLARLADPATPEDAESVQEWTQNNLSEIEPLTEAAQDLMDALDAVREALDSIACAAERWADAETDVQERTDEYESAKEAARASRTRDDREARDEARIGVADAEADVEEAKAEVESMVDNVGDVVTSAMDALTVLRVPAPGIG